MANAFGGKGQLVLGKRSSVCLLTVLQGKVQQGWGGYALYFPALSLDEVIPLNRKKMALTGTQIQSSHAGAT